MKLHKVKEPKEFSPFTKEELFEIEKVFDDIAINPHMAKLADMCFKLNNEKDGTKVVDQMLSNFDMCRTISAKCSRLRGKKE